MTDKPTYPIGIDNPVVTGTPSGRIVEDETRYTLAEAAVELKRRECAMSGHRCDVIAWLSGEPDTVICKNCGASWAIDNPERRARRRARTGDNA